MIESDDIDEGSTEWWRGIKKARQDKRADNRASSADILRKHGVLFDTRNGGAHLIVKHTCTTVDFWPGTGMWIDRSGTKGRGIRTLLTHIGAI